MVNVKKERFVFLPLGDSGEIGMNMNLFGYGKKNHEKWIMVDCGITFGDYTTPGIDLIAPDHQFIKERAKDLIAIVLTHAHEDHIGAIAHLWGDLKVPIYATAFTAKMVAYKFKDVGLVVDPFLHTIPLKAKLALSPFNIEFISITHSIPEPNGLLITTPLGKVYHTGDWKFDPDPVLGCVTDFERLHQLKNENIKAVICDSTNALDKGVSGSESSILEPMIQEIQSASHGVAITTFASNLARVKTLITAATKAGRSYTLLGRSLERIYNIGREMGYFGGVPDPIPLDEAQRIPKSKIVLLCTGSQGEDRAALGKIARGAHPMWNLSAGDKVIFSSKAIPGNEKAISKILNQLCELGVDVVTSKIADIHVSGHPCADELDELYRIIQPEYAIPVHGEARHMQRHAQIALKAGVSGVEIPKNGDVIEISPNFGYKESIEAGRLYIDGSILDDDLFGGSADRKRLAYAGCTSIFIHLNQHNNIVGKPYITSWGVPILTKTPKGNDELFVSIIHEGLSEINEISKTEKMTDYMISEHIRKTFRREVNRIWFKKPMTEVIIHRDLSGEKSSNKVHRKSQKFNKNQET
jgi:ribonuclease J